MRVAGLSLDELKQLIRDMVDEALAEREDEGDIREEIVARILADEASGEPNVPHDEAMRLAGLDDAHVGRVASKRRAGSAPARQASRSRHTHRD
jgi:hypothetical protein